MTAISSGQTLTISAGEIGAGIIVLNGGTLDVLSGGTADGTFVSNGGAEVVSSGGTSSGTVFLSGGTWSSYGTLSGTVPTGGAYDYVRGGNVVSGTLDSSGGEQTVPSGGTDTNGQWTPNSLHKAFSADWGLWGGRNNLPAAGSNAPLFNNSTANAVDSGGSVATPSASTAKVSGTFESSLSNTSDPSNTMSQTSMLDFSAKNQSMWGSGSSETLDSNQTLFDLQTTAGGTISWGLGSAKVKVSAGVELTANIVAGDSGSVDLSYPVDAQVTTPTSVTPGETFTVATAFAGLGQSNLTTEFPGLGDISLIATLNGDASISGTGIPSIPSLNTGNITEPITLFNLGTTTPQFDYTLPNGLDLTASLPGTFATDGSNPAQSNTSTYEDVTATGSGGQFFSISGDIIKLLAGPDDPLDVGINGLVDLTILGADASAGLSIAQSFTFEPTAVDVTVTPNFGGASETGVLGQSFSFTVPSTWSQTVSLATTYSLVGDLVSQTGFVGEFGVDLPIASLSIPSLHISTQPLADIPIFSADGLPIYLYQPAAFPLDGIGDVTDSYQIPLATAPSGSTFSVTPVTASSNENAGSVSFTITRSSDTAAQTVYVSTVDGASNGYSTNNGAFGALSDQAVTFAAGSSTQTVTVHINNLSLASGSETYGLIVQSATGQPLSTNLASTQFTILDNDQAAAAAFSLTPTTETVNEDAGSTSFALTRSNDATAQTVYLSTVDGTSNASYSVNNGDYAPLTNMAVSFAAGVSTAPVTVTIDNLGLTAGSMTFGLVAQSSAGLPASNDLASAQFTIDDNDTFPTSGSGNSSPGPGASSDISLSASTAWYDSGMQVVNGDYVTISASGKPTCSTTSSGSTIRSAGTRRWAISAPSSSKGRLC